MMNSWHTSKNVTTEKKGINDIELYSPVATKYINRQKFFVFYMNNKCQLNLWNLLFFQDAEENCQLF